MAIKASGSITLTRVNDGSTGQGVASITAQYYLSDSKTAQSGGSWLDAPPDWVRGKYMWTRNKIVYKNPTDTAYTSPVCDSSWEVANEVVEIANGKNTIYYSTAAPSVTDKKENDIWFDTDDGYKMYRFTSGAWVATQFGISAIAANAITAEKIATNAVTAGKILAGSVTTDKLAALSVVADKIAANAITAGKIAANAITAGNIQSNAITTDKISANAVKSTKLDTDELFVGDNAFINKLKAIDIDAANITTGTISNERINITGLISFEAFDKTLQPIFNVQGNKTYINGGMIATNTIKADKIDLLSGLTVQGANGKPVFNISRVGDTDAGTVEIDGLLKSSNFDESSGTGYQISTDGTAILNQAKISGEVVLPNAGMTNYGSQIGNDNLLLGSDEFRSNVNYPTHTYAFGADKLANDEIFTISIKGELGPRKESFAIYNSGGHVSVGRAPTQSRGADGVYRYTGKWKVGDSTNTSLYLYPIPYSVQVVSTIEWVKVERGNTATPWCPHKTEQFNYVRMWAGSDFTSRNTAPFRVYQNGDVFAANGTFTGLLRGTLDSGDVQIYNNAMTIHNPGTETEVVNIAANRSVFDSDFIMGSNKVVYSKGNGELNLSDTTFKCINPYGTVVIDKRDGAFGGLNVIGPSGGHHVIRGSKNTHPLGSLVFDSEGSKGTKGDFVFTRKDTKEDVTVGVEGDLSVKTKISTTMNGLELRFEADGWGFYAI